MKRKLSQVAARATLVNKRKKRKKRQRKSSGRRRKRKTEEKEKKRKKRKKKESPVIGKTQLGEQALHIYLGGSRF